MKLQWNGSIVFPSSIKRAFNENKEGFKGYVLAVFSNIQTRNSVPSTEKSGGVSSREDNVNGRWSVIKTCPLLQFVASKAVKLSFRVHDGLSLLWLQERKSQYREGILTINESDWHTSFYSLAAQHHFCSPDAGCLSIFYPNSNSSASLTKKNK